MESFYREIEPIEVSEDIPDMALVLKFPKESLKLSINESRTICLLNIAGALWLGAKIFFIDRESLLRYQLPILSIGYLCILDITLLIFSIIQYFKLDKIKKTRELLIDLKSSLCSHFRTSLFSITIRITTVCVISHLIAFWTFLYRLLILDQGTIEKIDWELVLYALFFNSILLIIYFRILRFTRQFSILRSKNAYKLNEFDYNEKLEPSLKLCLSKNPICAICLQNYVKGQKLAESFCGNQHFFHLKCLNEWLSRYSVDVRCPLCRCSLVDILKNS